MRSGSELRDAEVEDLHEGSRAPRRAREANGGMGEPRAPRLGRGAGHEEQVLGLQVQDGGRDARRVGRLHALAGLRDDVEGGVQIEPPLALDALAERLAREQLEHHVRLAALEPACVERLDDVRVPDVARRRCLAQEALDRARALDHVAVQDLERAAVLRELVLDLVDGAHPARAEPPDDAQLAGQQRPRGQRLRSARHPPNLSGSRRTHKPAPALAAAPCRPRHCARDARRLTPRPHFSPISSRAIKLASGDSRCWRSFAEISVSVAAIAAIVFSHTAGGGACVGRPAASRPTAS